MPLKNQPSFVWHWTQVITWIAFDEPSPIAGPLQNNLSTERTRQNKNIEKIALLAMTELVDAIRTGELVRYRSSAEEWADEELDKAGWGSTFDPGKISVGQTQDILKFLSGVYLEDKALHPRDFGYIEAVKFFYDAQFERENVLLVWPEKTPEQSGEQLKMPDLESLSPYLQFMIFASIELNLDCGERITKKVIIDWIKNNWSQDSLGEYSEVKAKNMATFMRRPEYEKGGNLPAKRRG